MIRLGNATVAGVLVVLVLSLRGAVWASGSPAGAAPHCPLTAQATPDNDIRLSTDDRPGGTTVGVPSGVQGKIRAIAARLLAKMQLSAQWFRCGELYPAIFKISVSPGLNLYVADLALGSGVEYFALILHDPANGAATKNPPLIHATSTREFGWKDPLLSKPLVSFARYFSNRPEIVFEERVHNGTVYNAAVYHHFDIGPGMALSRVLALEKRAAAIGAHRGTIMRDLEPRGAGRMRLKTYFQPADQPQARRELGYVIVESPGRGVPFRVTERHAQDRDSGSILVTYCGPDTPGDDQFLRDGYTFHY